MLAGSPGVMLVTLKDTVPLLATWTLSETVSPISTSYLSVLRLDVESMECDVDPRLRGVRRGSRHDDGELAAGWWGRCW